jgi:hypothetical protein
MDAEAGAPDQLRRQAQVAQQFGDRGHQADDARAGRRQVLDAERVDKSVRWKRHGRYWNTGVSSASTADTAIAMRYYASLSINPQLPRRYVLKLPAPFGASRYTIRRPGAVQRRRHPERRPRWPIAVVRVAKGEVVEDGLRARLYIVLSGMLGVERPAGSATATSAHHAGRKRGRAVGAGRCRQPRRRDGAGRQRAAGDRIGLVWS